jgi:hypothetical protein
MLGGATVIEASMGAVTVRATLFELIEPDFAPIVELPNAEPVARPVLVMLAPAEAVQLTEELMS